ncbi:MAG: M12 family metallo-peptidase, partial [Pirellulales bacterium]|nr:M12 family metallo-peptidase [Pirellulales bacterium]
MYDARSPGRALFYLTRRLIGHLKKIPAPQAPSLTQTPHEVERLEPRIVLTASFGGSAQILGVDAEHTLDTSGLWQSIDDLQMTNAETVSALSLSASKSFTLDHNLLATRLAATPVEFSGAAGNVITLPSPAGGFDQFAIWESAIMAPELAAKFPTIETFAGRGIDDPTASVRLDLTPQGFHAQVLSSQSTYYVDPFYHLQADGPYVSYFKTDALRDPQDNFSCFVQDIGIENSHEHDAEEQHLENRAITVSAGSDLQVDSVTSGLSTRNTKIGPLLSHGTQLRTYDLAVASTGEYTAYHGGTVEAAMSAIVTTMNRVNGIYETDIATRMVLVSNNDQLVYTDGSSDPYSNNDGGSMLSENQSNVDSVIGDANYDVGHVFSTGGGGVAWLGVIGDSGSKAGGVTGQGSPIGDAFDVDYVAHEMGHQFGANHTFNGNNGNRNASTAMEPGSASTIMGYAGIMGSDNLQSNSDAYFHSVSLDEMVAEITNGNANAAATITNTGNNLPTVDAGGDYTIPAATAFVLTATGSDPDASDALTYCWEQRDIGAQQGVSDGDNGSSPLFRSWTPTTSPERVFPRYSDLLAGTTVVGETLPTTSRAMNFRVVLRDNRAGGSAFDTDDMLVTVVDTGSPFQVTTANSAVSWTGGAIESVSWDVAGTDSGSINVATVDILLSTDGGVTYSTVVTGVANDGSHNIIVPNTPTSAARLKVQAVGNIFFDISNSDFTILAGGPG